MSSDAGDMGDRDDAIADAMRQREQADALLEWVERGQGFIRLAAPMARREPDQEALRVFASVGAELMDCVRRLVSDPDNRGLWLELQRRVGDYNRWFAFVTQLFRTGGWKAAAERTREHVAEHGSTPLSADDRRALDAFLRVGREAAARRALEKRRERQRTAPRSRERRPGTGRRGHRSARSTRAGPDDPDPEPPCRRRWRRGGDA